MLKKISTLHYSDPRVHDLLDHLFDSPPEPARLAQSTILGHVGDNNELLSVAVIEQKSQQWYLWLFGVNESHRGQGLASALLTHIEQRARDTAITFLHLVTYLRWKGMRRLLEKKDWFLENVRPGQHHCGIAEEWGKIISDHVPRIILIGASPNGRGAEYADTLRNHPHLGKIVAVHDADPAVFNHWPAHMAKSTDLNKLLAETHPDGAIMALPHAAYKKNRDHIYQYKSIPILHEKPLGISQLEILELDKHFEQHPSPIITGVQRRSHPGYLYLQQALQSTPAPLESISLKMSLGLQANSADLAWRGNSSIAGGGALIDIGYHAIDLVHFIAGSQLDILSCTLRVGDRPALGGELETGAVIYGRCASTWVRIELDRTGEKEEHLVCKTQKQVWSATREHVTADGVVQFTCERSWEKAEIGRLGQLSKACQMRTSPPALHEHINILNIIEQAYQRTSMSGLI